MAKILLKKKKETVAIILVFFVLVAWVFSSWPWHVRVAHAAVAFRSASPAVALGSGSINLQMPAGTVQDDVMIMALVAHDNVVITLPVGWTKFNELNNTTALRSTMAWKRAAAGEAGPYAVTHSGGNSIIGAITSYSGVITTGSPIDAVSMRANAASLTTTANSITTTVDGALIIFTSHYNNDFTFGHGDTPYTCVSGPASFTERIDAETTAGLDASLAIADAVRATAGATGTCTESMTGSATVNNGGLTALKPAPVANGPPSTPALAETPAFPNLETPDTTPLLGNFSSTDPESDAIGYEIQWDEDVNFGTPVTRVSSGFPGDAGWSAATFASGASVSYTVQSTLADGQTYWWRVRARDPAGSNTWSAYSLRRSFTINTALATDQWSQTTGDQFGTDTLTETTVTVGEVKIQGW